MKDVNILKGILRLVIIACGVYFPSVAPGVTDIIPPEKSSGESVRHESEDAGGMTAKQVMIAVDERYDGDTRRQTGALILIDKNSNQRIREFKEFSKKYGKDEKRISHVISPPEVRGTAFMSYEWDDRGREDEAWLYLPQLRKVKRLASTDKSSYFLGSDFTYADFIGLEIEDFEYQFEENEDENNGQQWIILAFPRPDIIQQVIDETGYKKVKYWVDKNKMIVTKAQYWLNEGHRVKYFSASEIEEIDGIWTVKKMQMVMTQGGNMLHASIFQLNNVGFNKTIDDKMFTTYAMEREVN